VRNIGFMGASTGVRLVFGIVTFAVMARALGPADFGRLMTALAVCIWAGAFANFGLATYALREIGAASQQEARTIMADLLCSKLLLLGVVLVCAVAILPWLPAPWPALVSVMLLAQVFDAITDLLNVGFRATGRFAAETRIATLSALLQFALVTGTLLLWPSLLTAAAAFCAARGLVLWLTWRGQREYFAALRPSPWRPAVARLKAARAYALDYGLQSLFGQVDSMVLAFHFGPAAVGVYQAGMRLFLGASQAATVLGSVAIPKLSGMRAQGQDITATSGRVQLAFVLVGATGGLAMASIPASFITGALGNGYAELSRLLPWFGLLFVIRMSASASGVLLTVDGRQTIRAGLTACHWVVIALSAWALLPAAGVQGWLVAVIAGNVALLLAYGYALHRTGRTRTPMLPMLASLASCAILLAFAVERH
jgi:O-antigen/teichoic acid export membrane protein